MGWESPAVVVIQNQHKEIPHTYQNSTITKNWFVLRGDIFRSLTVTVGKLFLLILLVDDMQQCEELGIQE